MTAEFFEKTGQSPEYSNACIEFLGRWQCFEKTHDEAHTIRWCSVRFGEDVEAEQEGHLMHWWNVSFGENNEEAKEGAHTIQ